MPFKPQNRFFLKPRVLFFNMPFNGFWLGYKTYQELSVVFRVCHVYLLVVSIINLLLVVFNSRQGYNSSI